METGRVYVYSAATLYLSFEPGNYADTIGKKELKRIRFNFVRSSNFFNDLLALMKREHVTGHQKRCASYECQATTNSSGVALINYSTADVKINHFSLLFSQRKIQLALPQHQHTRRFDRPRAQKLRFVQVRSRVSLLPRICFVQPRLQLAVAAAVLEWQDAIVHVASWSLGMQAQSFSLRRLLGRSCKLRDFEVFSSRSAMASSRRNTDSPSPRVKFTTLKTPDRAFEDVLWRLSQNLDAPDDFEKLGHLIGVLPAAGDDADGDISARQRMVHDLLVEWYAKELRHRLVEKDHIAIGQQCWKLILGKGRVENAARRKQLITFMSITMFNEDG